jgi:FMN phosphatase YigB (HAD superfamily)
VRLVITDVDNTLYDWVTYFASAFSAMLEELAKTLSLPRGKLLAEYKAVHRYHGFPACTARKKACHSAM